MFSIIVQSKLCSLPRRLTQWAGYRGLHDGLVNGLCTSLNTQGTLTNHLLHSQTQCSTQITEPIHLKPNRDLNQVCIPN